MITTRRAVLGLTAAALGAVATPAAAATRKTLYIGTYTTGAGGGSGVGIASYDDAGTITRPYGDYVLGVDLGTDSIYTYTLADGKLTLQHQATLKQSAGPRHLAFHPSGRFAYVADELDSTITICAYDDGVLTPQATLPTAPAGGPQNCPGEVVVSPDGRFAYLTNRGHNSVAVFATSDDGSALSLQSTPSCGGDWPAALHPRPERWVAVRLQPELEQRDDLRGRPRDRRSEPDEFVQYADPGLRECLILRELSRLW